MAEDAAAGGFMFNGVKYDFGALMLAEARAIQKVTGMTIAEWQKGLNLFDAEAITALIWVAMKRQNPTIRFEDVDGPLESFEPLPDPDAELVADDQGNDQGADAATPPSPTAGL
jgi:hypothetical protein